MVHSPNDALQSQKVSSQNSPRGRAGEQKSLKNPENPEKLSPGKGGGGTGVGEHFGTIRQSSISIDGTPPKLLWQIALVIIYKPTRFWVETHQGTGSVGKKVLKIPTGHEIMFERGPGTSASEDWGHARPYNHRTTEP